MLVIRLYKDVILNETYQNVFSLGKVNNKSILENYLETKDYYDIVCNYTYYENTGELVVDYELIKDGISSNIYEYNYMRIIEKDDASNIERLTRYCFINQISIKNGCVYIDYKEDIWSSYSDKIKGITESYLDRSRYKNYTNLNLDLISLPIEYDGNNKLDIEYTIYSKVFILAEIQYYQLTSAQQIGGRWLNYVLLASKDYSETNYTKINELKFDRYDAERGIARIINGITEGTINVNGTNYHYEIGDIYVIPEIFDIENLLDIGTARIPWGVFEGAGIFPGHCLVQFKTNERYILHSIYSNTIQNNYKNFSIGTFSNQIKIINNGTSFDYSILFGFTMNDISIKLSILNQVYDITNDFKFEIPYETLRSENFAQRKIGNQLQNVNNKYGMINESLNLVSDFSKVITGIGKTGAGFITGNLFASVNGVGDAMSAITDLGKHSINIAKLSEEKTLINAPMYSNAKGSFGNFSYFLNFFTGIVIFKINSDNDNYVIKTINNFGYKVYKFIDEFDNLLINEPNYFLNQSIYYNVIRFSNVNIYGSFPREVANIINEILTEGVKIWYDYQMRDDNYVI